MKVISIIDSIDLYGKERANIQVANILRKYDFELTVLVNTDAKKDLLKELASLNTFRMPFHRNITASKYRIWQYIKRYI